MEANRRITSLNNQLPSCVSVEKRDDVAILRMNSPPVNALSSKLRNDLVSSLKECTVDNSIKGIVLTGTGKVFCAGADISEFAKGGGDPDASFFKVFDLLDNCSKPITAALNGTTLGGGLELALACNYRIADSKAKLALPEVRIGLIPGAGGTQRLPRLIGVQAALSIVASGNNISASKALDLQLVDGVTNDMGSVVDEAIAKTRTAIKERNALPRCRLLACSAPEIVFEYAKQQVMKSAPGMHAPLRAIEAVEWATKVKTFEDGMKKESELFAACFLDPESKALQHLFFAERLATRPPRGAPPPLPIKSAAVIGAGTMGAGIAICFANVGIKVFLVEVNSTVLEKGLLSIRQLYETSHKNGKLSMKDMEARLKLIRPTLDYKDLSDVDVVVEAAVENMKLKQKIFAQLDQNCKPSCILATNTSTLDINELASATNRPHKVVGMHFFSPANVMRLLENVRTRSTDLETQATVMDLGRRLRKTSVLVGCCWAFVANRMLFEYMRQAQFMLMEGALPAQVDSVLRKFGFPMGPFQLSDVAGVDVFYHIMNEASSNKTKSSSSSASQRFESFLNKLYSEKRWGQKTGKGWYMYPGGARKAVEDPVLTEMLLAHSKELGITRRAITDDEILDRCLCPLVNEGAKILEEGIAARASDIDIIWVHGFGFPPYKGGPLHWADGVGLGRILNLIRVFADRYGAEYWTTCPLLERLATSGSTFANHKV